MKRLFRANKRSVLDYPARVTDVKLELARYLPEISAIIRYDIETNPGAASKTIYGKVQHSGRGAESNRVMTEIWKEFKRSKLALRVPRPLGYYPELGLYLQDSVPGKALANDRTAPEYLPAVMQAAEALAAIHESGIPTVNELPLEAEVARLDRTLDQFALVHPNAYFLLREYLTHMRETLKKLPEEEWLPTHGDFKYDQLLVDPDTGNYSLIDFDFFGRAETSYDVARFCAYVMPSMPKDWEQSYAGEQARQAFLRRYRELRPDATLHRFPIYESVNLAGRAMTLMWSQMRNWESAAESMLVLAMERLKSKAP
jgi:thiamine kinase-like enzyme